jgi:hypothetical protein
MVQEYPAILIPKNPRSYRHMGCFPLLSLLPFLATGRIEKVYREEESTVILLCLFKLQLLEGLQW